MGVSQLQSGTTIRISLHIMTSISIYKHILPITVLSHVRSISEQVARALVPAIVMLVSMVYFGKTYSTERKWAVVPVVIGVALTFYGGNINVENDVMA